MKKGKVISVTPISDQDEFVYDITVEDNHNYLANGIVVHNCVDEAMRVTDAAMSTRLLPMIGSSEVAKVVKLGIPAYKNHFFDSFNSPQYKKIIKDWTQCPILLKSGEHIINGKPYSQYVLDRMPFTLKQKMFPNNPEEWTEGDMTELDFKIQYAVEWVDDLSLLLSKEDHKNLVGDHEFLEAGADEEIFYFGLDMGSDTPLEGTELDFTSLTIMRHRNNVKEKVFCAEWQRGVIDQMEEIISIVHPKTGRFKCKFGLADYSNVGIVVVESFKKKGLPIEGIIYAATDKMSNRNYKNAMADQFVFELKHNRVKYPHLRHIERIPCLKKHYHEWGTLESQRSLSGNRKISGPNGRDDDGANSDMLAVFAIDRTESFKAISRPMSFPMPLRTNPVNKLPGFQKNQTYFGGKGLYNP